MERSQLNFRKVKRKEKQVISKTPEHPIEGR